MCSGPFTGVQQAGLFVTSQNTLAPYFVGSMNHRVTTSKGIFGNHSRALSYVQHATQVGQFPIDRGDASLATLVCGRIEA
jgi:hypothetical protein